MIISEIKAVVFDLDNTLYDVEQYFSGAFQDIATYMNREYGKRPNDVYKLLMDIWKDKTSMYPHLFNDMLECFGLNDEKDVRNIVHIFNDYKCKIEPYTDAIPTIMSLRDYDIMTGIITDGTAYRQKRKIQELGLCGFFDMIIYTAEMGCSKPSELPFNFALEKLGTMPCQTIYVGDNPYLDFKGAKATGMETMRLLKGEFSRIDKNEWVDYKINNLSDILDFL